METSNNLSPKSPDFKLGRRVNIRRRRKSRFIPPERSRKAKNPKLRYKNKRRVPPLINHSYQKGSFAKREFTPRTKTKNVSLIKKFQKKLFTLSSDLNSDRSSRYFNRTREELKDLIKNSKKKK